MGVFKKLLVLALALAAVLVPGSVFGHHALEYIELESYTQPAQGQGLFHLHYDYFVPDEEVNRLDHWEFTPGLAIGLTNWLMFDVHAHFAGFGWGHITPEHQAEFDPALGMPPFFEAAAATLQVQLTKPGQFPIGIGAAFTYETPFNRSREYLDGGEVYQGTLIFFYEFSEHRNICANFYYGSDGGESFGEWGIGAKSPLSPDPNGIAAGVEVLGDFEGGLSVLPGVYFPLTPQTLIKTGFQFGNEKWEQTRASVNLLYLF